MQVCIQIIPKCKFWLKIKLLMLIFSFMAYVQNNLLLRSSISSSLLSLVPPPPPFSLSNLLLSHPSPSRILSLPYSLPLPSLGPLSRFPSLCSSILPLPLLTINAPGCSANSPADAVQPHVPAGHHAGVWEDPHLPGHGQGLPLCQER